MYPQRPNFSTTRNGDAWYIRHIRLDDGRPSHDEVCHTSGALFLSRVASIVRWDMMGTRSQNPYELNGVRYTTPEQIDRDFFRATAWTPTILAGWNEYRSRRSRPTVQNPFVRQQPMQIIPQALSILLFRRMIAGGIGGGSWGATLGDPADIEIPEDAILPRMNVPLGSQLPSNEVVRCTHRSMVDASYQQIEYSSNEWMWIVAAAAAAYAVAKIR